MFKRVVQVLAVVGAAWFVAVVLNAAAGGDAAKLGAVGDAMAPIGTTLTALAFYLAFKQQHEDAERRQEDAANAHRDKLIDAYADWYDRMLLVLTSAHDAMRSGNMIGLGHSGDLSGSLALMVKVERDLKLAATRLYVLERDAKRAKRVAAASAPLQSFQGRGVNPGGITSEEMPAYKAHAVAIEKDLLKRRADVEEIYQDVALDLGAHPIFGWRPKPRDEAGGPT